MTPSELISAVTFLIITPTMLIIHLLTLLNLNAVVFYYPSGPSHESRPLASFDNNSTPVSDLKDQTTDFLPLWLTHILKNHDVSQLMPQWKGLDAPVVVSIHLTVDFAQPPANHSFDQMVTINVAGLKHYNGIPQAVSPSNTFMHPHGKTGFHNHENHEPRTEKPFQPAAVTNLLIHALGPILIFLAAWRRASHFGSSYRSFLRVIKNSRVTVPFRGHDEYAKDQNNPQVPSYGDIISEESDTHDYLPTHVESSIQEWTPEDDYETDVTNIIEPDVVALLLQDLVAGFEEFHLLRITPDSSFCSEALSHLDSVPCEDSDCTIVDEGVTICRSEREVSQSYYKPGTELEAPRALDLHSAGDNRHVPLEVHESGYFAETEVSLVNKRPNPPRHARETSSIHIPRQLTSRRDPSTVTSRELVPYLRHPRAWEVDDLVAAWRCFVRSRRGKRWVTYGIVGIAILLQAAVMNFLASGL